MGQVHAIMSSSSKKKTNWSRSMSFLFSLQFLWNLPFKLLPMCCLKDDTLYDRSAIPVEDIVDLLEFCLSTTNFKYNNTHYQQIFGTAMGSPVSAVMANLVIENLEKRTLFTSLVQPRFWKRYVDDVCAAVKSGLVQTLQDHLNNIEPSIQFTVEREKKPRNSLPRRVCLSTRQRSTCAGRRKEFLRPTLC